MTPDKIAWDRCDEPHSLEKLCNSCKSLKKDIQKALDAQQEKFLEMVFNLTHDESGLAEGDPQARMMAVVGDMIERKIRGKLLRLKP